MWTGSLEDHKVQEHPARRRGHIRWNNWLPLLLQHAAMRFDLGKGSLGKHHGVDE